MAGGSWIRINAVDAHLDARTVNEIIKTALSKKAVSITQKPELRKTVGEYFVDAVTPFVPFKSGDLSRSGAATADGRVYWTSVHKGYNYAELLYDEYGDVWPNGYTKPTRTVHKNPTPRWVEMVHPGTKEWEIFITKITPEIRRAFAEDEQK